jgi:hypothetical protein
MRRDQYLIQLWGRHGLRHCLSNMPERLSCSGRFDRAGLEPLAALRIVDAPIPAAGNKDVRRQRVVFGFRCRKLGLDITYRRSESFQCILKATRTHYCSTEHIVC